MTRRLRPHTSADNATVFAGSVLPALFAPDQDSAKRFVE
jgi:hypothetical protein